MWYINSVKFLILGLRLSKAMRGLEAGRHLDLLSGMMLHDFISAASNQTVYTVGNICSDKNPLIFATAVLGMRDARRERKKREDEETRRRICEELKSTNRRCEANFLGRRRREMLRELEICGSGAALPQASDATYWILCNNCTCILLGNRTCISFALGLLQKLI